ncbi:MAG: antitoxin CptB [Pseudomonadales bacterium]|jgi:antitoxin CptB
MMTDVEYRKIYWHSRRGMLELDLILIPFVENHLRNISAEEQQLYVKFLEEEDNDMFSWFMRADVSQKPEIVRMVEIILACNKDTIQAG